MPPQVQEYGKTHTLCLNPDEGFKFTFGVKKAKMIIENFDVIKQFYEDFQHEIDIKNTKEKHIQKAEMIKT